MKTHSLKEPILSVLEESKKRDCRTELIEMYLAIQPMTPVMARLTLKQYVTSENFEPVYTIRITQTEGVETKIGKDVFSSPRKKSVLRNHKLLHSDEPSKYYKYSDDFTAAYCVMSDYARRNRVTLTAATVTFNDEVCLAAKAHKRGIVACISERIKGNSSRPRKGWTQMLLVAIEECDSALPVVDAFGNHSKRLHAHLLTLTSHQMDERMEDLRLRLKSLSRERVRSDVEITNTYIGVSPYTDSDRLDEEFNGELPTNEKDSYSNPDRMGVWKGVKSGKEVVFSRLPLDQGWADYMSKDIDKDASERIQNKTFGMINGLSRDVALYRELKYLEGRAFQRIDFEMLDNAIAQIRDEGSELEISKVLEKYYKLIS
jgi:hypothetical protein